jgi:hypothetical protein
MKRLKSIWLGGLASMPLFAFAHDEHGNTPLHAVLHMLEENGVWILLLFVVILYSLIRANRQSISKRVSHNKREDSPHDSR